MKLQRFNIYEDLEHVNRWLKKRGSEPVTHHDLPEAGYMAWHFGRPLGAIFLRRCEGGAGIVDSLISNPDAPGELRHIALDALITRIIEHAKKSKIKFLLGYTIDDNTHTRSIRLGFEDSPYRVVVKKL